eukprot:TRINITY_DN12296_c0_g1_i1.p1 TRINITY_DN12296_c0_g1~~TRINITY_DN12296_c0_g1_i1.p1  ORF type:complete len:103 (+),score=9.82 TRINITY_DN12296_c0_g1_i1:50-358(+)
MVGFRVNVAADSCGEKANLQERFYERPSMALVLERFERVFNERFPGGKMQFSSALLYDPFTAKWTAVPNASALYDNCQLYLVRNEVFDVSGLVPPSVPVSLD